MSTEERSSKKGLGRGLSALLGEAVPIDQEAVGSNGLALLAIERIVANPDQPRRHFAEEALAELAASIREKGVLQPILVRPLANDPGLYEIIAGERRWRAAQRAQVHKIPAIIRELSDGETLEIALIENIQRQDLSPIEEAAAYQRLIEARGYHQESLGQMVGKSRSHVSNMLRLLNLPAEVQTLLDQGQISMGHARALIGSSDPVAFAREVVARGLTVREVEALMQRARETTAKPRPARAKDPDTRALENDISQALGLKVDIVHRGKNGAIKISYATLEQLDEVCQRLCQFPGAKRDFGIREI